MITNSSAHELGIIAEATYGVTPANPSFARLPLTATNLGLTKGLIKSEAIRSHRQQTDVRHGNRQVGGELSAEFAYGVFDTLLEAALCGTWTANVLVPGTVRRSFSVLRQFVDIAAPEKGFQRTLGMEVNTLSLALQPESLAKIVFGCFGRELLFEAAAPAGTAYTEPDANKAFDGFSGQVLVGGDVYGTVTEVQLTLENGIEPRFVLFDDKTQRPKIGKTMVSGNITTFFENADLLEAFSTAEKKSLTFELTDLIGNTYRFELPSILLNGGQTDVSGEADVTVKIPFQAIYEAGSGTPDALMITRIPD
jgi:hypothetical protein